MSDIPNIVNLNQLEWTEKTYSEHYSSLSKRLSPSMSQEKGHIGVVVERLQPGKSSCPFHFHLHEDEFFLVLKGRAMLRLGEQTVEVQEGDAISCPRGERIAHQLYNHTDEDTDILMVGENLPHEVCYYPDSDKWMSCSIGMVGKFQATDYWADEPDPPTIRSSDS
ncbi:MAG: cupin domain-containing protein [Gemmatimonadaceae bacterium]|nr:cupin domain-containing protein [Gloeobacterales cyanobacterium ES-bin-141]